MSDRLSDWLLDPVALAQLLWPDTHFYGKQRDILYSVRDNDETFVPAANKVGKDFVAGYTALWFMLSSLKSGKTCRIVTTSVKEPHLVVLWGEIGRFIETARSPLTVEKGGPLLVNHQDIRKVQDGAPCRISYLLGMVSKKGEGMAGHHAEMTLGIVDEASGVDDIVYSQMDTWAKRKLVIGNPLPCANFFRRAVKAGDLLAG